MSYLNFTKRVHDPNKKTDIWDVASSMGGGFLGTVNWYSPWRKYCYCAAGPQVLDAACMTEIVGFLQTENVKHKAILADRKAEVV